MSVRFEASNQVECTARMKALCNDGRCWTVAVVFGLVTAKPFATVRNVPRTPASEATELDSLYWQNGQWHKRRPATQAMVDREWRQADKAAGVSDGGSERAAMKAFFRRLARKTRRATCLA